MPRSGVELIRRAPKAIITAHRMYPSRRELYVEGRNDKIFLDYLVGGEKHPDARIIEIKLVDMPASASGGEKGRLLDFAQEIEGAGAQIKAFADADTDRILGRSRPANVLLTDKRDLEGYVLREECVEKVLKLGLLEDALNAEDVLRRTNSLGRQLGVLRIMSEIDELELPFQRTDLSRHIDIEGYSVQLRLENYVRALIQNASMSLKVHSEILDRHREVADEYSHVDDAEIVHGKDAVIALERLLRAQGLPHEATGSLLRCSFERQWIEGCYSLEQVYEFLTA